MHFTGGFAPRPPLRKDYVFIFQLKWVSLLLFLFLFQIEVNHAQRREGFYIRNQNVDISQVQKVISSVEEWNHVARFFVPKLKEMTAVDIQGYQDIREQIDCNATEIKLMYYSESKNFNKRQYDPKITPILLHGCSGTGKTHLAHYYAQKLKDVAAFFTITSGSLTSRYQGDSEKNVTNLFNMMSAVGPSLLFIDEGEVLLGDRSQFNGGNSTASNMSALLLTLLPEAKHVFIIIASNYPWIMDKNFRRRLPAKFHVGLPTNAEKTLILKSALRNYFTLLTDSDYSDIAQKMELFTPSDVMIIVSKTISKKCKEKKYNNYYKPFFFDKDVMVPCHQNDSGCVRLQPEQTYLNDDIHVVLAPILKGEIEAVIRNHKNTVTKANLEQHQEFQRDPDYAPQKKNELTVHHNIPNAK